MRFIHWLTGNTCRTNAQSLPRTDRTPAPTRARLTLQLLEARDVPSVNAIVAENMLPGNAKSEWDLVGGVGDPTIEGFAADLSVDQGQTVQFKINAPASAPYHIDIYRMGYYNGAGARKVATIPSSQTLRQTQPAALRDNSTGLVDAGNWSVSASWAVPTTAVSGIYFAKLVREDTGGANHIVFVVRDDDGRADVLFQTADTTWQAYNKWGGASLYGGAATATGKAYKVSYNRPFTARTDTPNGRDYVFGPEFAMVRWLEANGYSTSYSTGIDTDRSGPELLEHKVFMSVGHDEYWSGAQRRNVEAARDAGVNLMFLSGNELYWKIRWENSIDASGTSYRTLVCYKETSSGAPTDPSTEWTGTWRDPRWRLPGEENQLAENAVTGQLWTVNRGPGGETGTPFQVPYEYSGLRFWRNTTVANLQPGQTATLGDIVLGYEWDEDIDNGFRPAGLFRMSSTTQTVPERINDIYTNYAFGSSGANPTPQVIQSSATHSLTLYRAASGALVFGAGTVQWSYGLEGTHDGPQTTPDATIRQATVNMLADMGVQAGGLQAGLIQTSASFDITRPTSGITFPTTETLQVGVPVTIVGTASDNGGGRVAVVEVSTDGGATWHRATGTTSWTYAWTPTKTGPAVLKSRVADDSGNIELPAAGVTVNVVLGTNTSRTGLVAAYDFNTISGNTLQSSVSSTNGTISGGASPTTAGKFGGALVFDGIDDIVTVADTNSLDLTTGMTLEAWVKPTAAKSYATVLLKETSNELAYALYASDAGASSPAATYLGSYGSVGASALPLNTWSHLTATYNGSTLSLYVNGSLTSSRTVAGPITTSTGALQIGGNLVFSNEFFAGLIDEVRVYNRALNQTEILSDMSTPVGGSLDGTPPTVSVSSSGGSGNVVLTASASDATLVTGVQFLLNGQPLGAEVTTGAGGTFTYVWNTTQYPNGTYQISARARDAIGNAATALAIGIATANDDTVAPTVALTGLTPNSTVGGTVVLSATASDTVAVVGVQFKVDGTNIGSEVTAAPYRTLWDTTGLASGTHVVTAVARDAAGNTSISAVSVVVDATLPTITARTPAAGATDVPTSVDPTVTFSESIQFASASFGLKDPAGNLLATTATYDDTTKTVVLHPLAALQPASTYTLTAIGVRDLIGNALAGTTTWSFTSASQITGATIWNDLVTPAVASANDTAAVELGVKFRSSTSGYITGVRFYKGAGNTGTHVGKLWSSTGTLLASATFTSETATGWQQVSFSSPVAITANTTYVASYYAPNGGYAVNSAYFASAVISAPLRALASGEDGPNGLYKYGSGGGFPNGSFNSSNYWVDVVFGSDSQDTTPPAIATRTPAPGATELPANTVVTVTFTESIQANNLSFVLKTASGSTVASSVIYNDATMTATLTPTSALATGATYTVEVSGIRDAAGNTASGTVSWSFTTAAQAVNATSVWASSVTPAVASANDTAAVELGVKFRSSTSGYITGVRFYKGAGNTGTHVGKLWSSTGTLLASATFTSETATGWQQVSFSSPVAITANTTYVASYYAPNGGYAVNSAYFASAGASNGNLQLLASGVDGPNGLYKYGAGGGFPNGSFNSSNYWVDVVYSDTVADTTPPQLVAQTPAPGATAVPVSSVVTATFSESVTSNSVSFVLKDAANNTVSASVSYNDTTRTATLTPTSALTANTTYTPTVSATDAAGNAMQAVSWSFTTPTPVTNTSLWSASATPQTASASDTAAIELGVRFFSEVSGYITGVRFYKGAGNTGTHVGKLWSSTGTLLASATFTSETATGWQQVNFSTPVAITANTTYVASYYAPNGGYAYTGAGFAGADVVNGYLHAPQSNANAGNGLYKYGAGGGFPNNTFNSNNYWVDVVFSQSTSDTTAPTIMARTPTSGSVGVLPNAAISVTFSEAINPSTVSFVLKDAFNATVAGNLNYDPATHVATFVPSVPLLPFLTYSATVSGAKDLSGNTLAADSTWAFRTRGIWVQTSASDFGTGTNDGTTVTNGSGGEVSLAALLSETFDGSALSAANWSVSSWSSDGGGPVTTSVANGVLALGGVGVYSTTSYANSALEGRIKFGAAAYQHFGLATGLDAVAGRYWALFSTKNTSNTLYARVNANGTTTDVALGALPSGFHTYRIKPLGTGFEFYVDNVLQTTIAASFQTTVSMKAALSDYLGSGSQLLEADSVSFLNFNTSQTGTFTSTQFDTGSTATLSTVNFSATVPSGTSLTVRVRVGSLVNGVLVWTGWATVANGAVPVDGNGNALVGQYIQYAVEMSTTNAALTPRFDDIAITWA